jgi:hypothetical protein
MNVVQEAKESKITFGGAKFLVLQTTSWAASYEPDRVALLNQLPHALHAPLQTRSLPAVQERGMLEVTYEDFNYWLDNLAGQENEPLLRTRSAPGAVHGATPEAPWQTSTDSRHAMKQGLSPAF